MRKLIAITVVASQVVACGTQTTFRLRSGPELRADVAGRIDNTLYLRTGYGKRTVNACDVVEVGHPGKAAAITGISLLGVGLLLLVATVGASSFNDDDRHDSSDTVAGGVYSAALFATGGALAGWGFTQWNGSAERTGDLPATQCDRSENPGDKGVLRYQAPHLGEAHQAPVRPDVSPSQNR